MGHAPGHGALTAETAQHAFDAGRYDAVTVAARRGRPECNNINGLDGPTRRSRGIESIDENPGLTNPETGLDANENPGALAGATGVESFREERDNREYCTPKPRRKATSLSKLMRREHLKMTRMLGYTLVLGTLDAWQGFARVAEARLDVKERAALAWAALRSLDADTAAMTVEAAFEPEGGAGMPMVPLDDFADEAAFWAERAAPDELAAYAVAIFKAMPKRRKRDFATYVQEVA